MGRGWTGAVVVALIATLTSVASAPASSAAAPVARAWGENNASELGIATPLGSGTVRTRQVAVRNAANTADFGSASEMDGGNDHAVWLKADETVHLVGDDSLGQLGNGVGEADANTPQALSLTDVLQVDA